MLALEGTQTVSRQLVSWIEWRRPTHGGFKCAEVEIARAEVEQRTMASGTRSGCVLGVPRWRPRVECRCRTAVATPQSPKRRLLHLFATCSVLSLPFRCLHFSIVSTCHLSAPVRWAAEAVRRGASPRLAHNQSTGRGQHYQRTRRRLSHRCLCQQLAAPPVDGSSR